ncbi:unnamed protein product [Prunus armeniaca]
MAAEDGALFRPAMEGSRYLPVDQAVRSASCYGPVALGRGPVLLIVSHHHHEPSVWHDDANHARNGRSIRPLPSRRGGERRFGRP